MVTVDSTGEASWGWGLALGFTQHLKPSPRHQMLLECRLPPPYSKSSPFPSLIHEVTYFIHFVLPGEE